MINPEHLAQLTCQECSKKEHCKAPCIFVDKIAGGKKSCRELIPPPEPPETGRDYKEVLIELQLSRVKQYNISDIRDINDIRVRAIAAMTYANISKADQARMMNISVRTIERQAGLK
jgi:hypothetical protein